MPEHASAGHGRTQPPVATVPRTPPSVPDHKLLRCIGRGSYGDVWLARNVVGTLRAVKIVYRDAFADARPYEREFRGMQKFEPLSRTHPGLVNLLQIGLNEAAGCFCYVMELADDASEPVVSNQCSVISPPLPGDSNVSDRPATSTDSLNTDPLITDYSPRTLASDLKSQGRLPFAQCLRAALALADALEHLHRHGLIHRDIKPSNIIFVHGAAKLADIGLVTETGAGKSWVGTEGFMPPEGPGTAQGDIYSLGKVLYEISTGKDRQRFPEPLTALADLPDHADWLEFNEVVAKTCAGDPKQRYASATALHQDLLLLQAGKSLRRHRATERQLARFKKWGAWAAAAALALVGGLFVFQWKGAAETRAARRESLLREVQMIRLNSRTNGWFDACWEKLHEFTRLQPDEKARDDARTQAAACLSGLDAKLVDAITNAGAFSLAFSPDGQWLLCAGLTHERTRAQQSAHLWRSSRREEAHSSSGKDQSLLTSAATNRYDALPSAHSSFAIRHSQFLPLPVSGDAVAAWKPDGTPNGTPVLFLPGPTNCFLLVEARTSNVLQRFPLEGNPHQGNEHHPVLALTPDARLAAASVTLMGDTGDPPVPVGDSPTGTAARNSAGPRTQLPMAPQPVPPGGSPGGTGQWPVLPQPTGRFAVWDTATGDTLFQTNEPASALAFSPDGRALAVGDAEGRVRVFALPERGPERGLAVRSGNELEPAPNSSTNSPSDPLRIANPRSAALLAEFPSARVRINCFAFTPDPIVPRAGPLPNAWWLAVGDAGGTIRIWRTVTREQLNTSRGSHQDVFTMAFHPDGVTLASAGRLDARFWDAATGQLLLRLPPGQRVSLDYARALTFAPDGGTIALGNERQNESHFISQWRWHPARGVRVLRGLSAAVMRVWFSPDGRHIAAMTADWHLGVWEMATERLLRVFETPRGDTADNAAVAFHPDGARMAFSCADEAVLADLKTGKLQHHWPLGWGLADEMTYTLDTRLLLLRRESTNGIQRPFRWLLRELDESSSSRVLHEQTNIAQWHPTAFALLPDGRHFAVTGYGTQPDAHRETHFFDATSGRRLWVIDHHMRNAPTLAVDPHGRFMLYDDDSATLLCSLPDGMPVGPAACHPAISSEAGVLASYALGGCVVLFGRLTNAPTLLFGTDLRPSGARLPVFSRQGQHLAWGTEVGIAFVARLVEVRAHLGELDLDVITP